VSRARRARVFSSASVSAVAACATGRHRHPAQTRPVHLSLARRPAATPPHHRPPEGKPGAGPPAGRRTPCSRCSRCLLCSVFRTQVPPCATCQRAAVPDMEPPRCSRGVAPGTPPLVEGLRSWVVPVPRTGRAPFLRARPRAPDRESSRLHSSLSRISPTRFRAASIRTMSARDLSSASASIPTPGLIVNGDRTAATGAFRSGEPHRPPDKEGARFPERPCTIPTTATDVKGS
jgi:hypothetical protein